MTWDDAKTLKLIKTYSEHEGLWNPKSKLYKIKQHRQETLGKLAKQFEVDQRELERKLKNLTSHYYREMKKVYNPKLNYVSKWFAFDAFHFIKGKNRKFLLMETGQEDSFGLKDVDYNPECSIKSARQGDNSDESSEEDNVPISSFKTEVLPTMDSAKASRTTGTVISKKRKINKFVKNNEDRDEFSVLGEEVAMKVRNVRTNYGRCTVKHKIQTILYEAGLGMYDYPPDHFGGLHNLNSPETSSTANSRLSPNASMSPSNSIEGFVSIKSEPEII